MTNQEIFAESLGNECLPERFEGEVDFYTYTYLRPDGTPYYVGKGRGARARTKHHFRIPVPPKERILYRAWESENEALWMEEYYISNFGRLDLMGEDGLLHNRTDGGLGAVRRTRHRKKTCAELCTVIFRKRR